MTKQEADELKKAYAKNERLVLLKKKYKAEEKTFEKQAKKMEEVKRLYAAQIKKLNTLAGEINRLEITIRNKVINF